MYNFTAMYRPITCLLMTRLPSVVHNIVQRRIAVMLTLLLLSIMLPGCRSDMAQQASLDSSANEIPGGALDGSAKPLAYYLHMHIDPRQQQFSGTLQLDVEMLRADDGIWLHGQGLTIQKISLRDSDIAVDYTQMLDSGVVRIGFAKPLPAGQISLLIDYQASFDNNLAGLFRVQEQGDWYALAKSESIQARKYLPGFDQPGFKAPMHLTLDIPTGYQAITNTPVYSQSVLENGITRWQFLPTPAMPTYLLSLAVGPFDVVEYPAIPANAVRAQEIPLRAVARRGQASNMRQVMEITAEFVYILETELGVAYPFRKLDIVAAPAWPSGATELSAAISYREERLFLPEHAPPAARLGMLGIHAHELAHMWFGNLVTPPWWDDLWLKEGFATWATPLVLTRFEPEQSHALNGLQRNFAVMAIDSLTSARAIREPILRNEDIRNAYDGITYSKSQAVLHMLDSYFGAPRFRAALADYLRTYAHAVAASPDFYRSIADSMQQPELITTLRSFVEQAGVPLLDVQPSCPAAGSNQSATITLTQQRYLPLGSPAQQEQTWSIPVCLRYGMAAESYQQCHIMNDREMVLQLPAGHCPDWIMPNAAGSGYYRWQFATADWHTLLTHFERLDAGEKLAMVDSLQAAIATGNARLESLLSLLEVMLDQAQQQPRQVLEAPLPILEDYLQRVLPPAPATQLRTQLQQLYREFDSCAARLDSIDKQLLCRRMQKFKAQSLGDSLLRADLADRASRFIGLNAEPVPAALDADRYELALSVAVQDLGARFYQRLIEFAKDFDDPRLAAAVPTALGAFTDPSLLPLARAMLLQNPAASDLAAGGLELGPRERFDMIMSMLSTTELREQHWRWYQQHLPQILALIPEQWRRRTPNAGAVFCAPEQAAQLQRLFAEHGALAPGHERALAQTQETINLCSALRQAVTAPTAGPAHG